MPELPEIETVKRALDPAIVGKTIVKVDQKRPDLRVPFPAHLSKKLKGRNIKKITRRAKYILIELDNDNVLVFHLGMSGRILILLPHKEYHVAKHDHLIITLSDGTRVILNDARRFGFVLLLHKEELSTHHAFINLGPEPLSNNFSGPVLFERLQNKKTTIKSALLDQRIVAGLGNIYVCEALFYSCISPFIKACELTQERTEILVKEIRLVLERAIQSGGSSLRDYRQADNSLGYFQHELAVYGRQGLPCAGCSCDVNVTGGVQRIVQSGRSTFYCKEKQKS